MGKPRDHTPPEMRKNPFEEAAAAYETQAMELLTAGSNFKDFGRQECVVACYTAAAALQNLASKVRALQLVGDDNLAKDLG